MINPIRDGTFILLKRIGAVKIMTNRIRNCSVGFVMGSVKSTANNMASI
jgi:hypothetical protein